VAAKPVTKKPTWTKSKKLKYTPSGKRRNQSSHWNISRQKPANPQKKQ